MRQLFIGCKKYRARGIYLLTMRDSWVTKVWRTTREEAQDDIKHFCSAATWDLNTLRVVEVD